MGLIVFHVMSTVKITHFDLSPAHGINDIAAFIIWEILFWWITRCGFCLAYDPLLYYKITFVDMYTRQFCIFFVFVNDIQNHT